MVIDYSSPSYSLISHLSYQSHNYHVTASILLVLGHPLLFLQMVACPLSAGRHVRVFLL